MSRQAELAPFRGREPGDPKRLTRSQGRIAARERRSATSPREPVSSPRRHKRRKGVRSVDARPSELDPYPRSDRDLGSAVLWERSRNRSQRRRERARRARREAPRRKGVTIATGAAILA